MPSKYLKRNSNSSLVLSSLHPLVARSTFTTQNTLLGSINPDRNHQLRVMSTPEWPVPYYQRQFRHPPSLEHREGNLNHFCVPVHDFHVIMAKEALKSSNQGYIVEAIENHFDLDTYATSFKDSSLFSQAYVDDALDCLGIAFE